MLDPRDAIADLTERFPNSVFVSTCGFITRDLLAVEDRPTNFYLVGSMGMALPVALGIVATRPDLHVVAIDGDGSFAMNLGASALVGELHPRIVHAVIDNARHESTGGQRTVAPCDYAALAKGLGYDTFIEIDALPDSAAVGLDQSVLLRYRCGDRRAGAGPRLQLTPNQLVSRFASAIGAVQA